MFDHFYVVVGAAAGVLLLLLVLYFLTDSGPCGQISFGPATHVIITGGSSGIGLATAVMFRKRNCNVTIIARNVGKLDEAKVLIDKEAKGHEGELHVVSADVASKGQIEEAVQSACAKFNNRVGKFSSIINQTPCN